jgi:hypothetical protein
MYMLLTPLNEDTIGITQEEIVEALEEFACKAVLSTDHVGITHVFAVSDRLLSLENLCNTVDINGCVIEYVHVYDMTPEIGANQ